jgi:hypothetical protein
MSRLDWYLDLAACAPDEDDVPLTPAQRAELDDLRQLALDDRAHGE